MKYRVLGYSKDNGSKINMEMEASSKAEAERKALKSNLEVVRVELSSVPDPRLATMPNRHPNMSPLDSAGASASRARSRGGSSGLFKLCLFILFTATIAYGVYHFWPHIQKFIPGFQK